MLNIFLIGLISAILIGFIIFRYEIIPRTLSGDHDFLSVQKFHSYAVPRVGGVIVLLAILLSILASFFCFDLDFILLTIKLFAAALPAFLIGLIEDLSKNIGVKLRLFFITVSALLAGHLLNSWIVGVNIIGFDHLLSVPFISAIFTCFAVVGVVNSFNLIDGFNGLASGVGLIIICAISYVAFHVADYSILFSCLASIGAIFGFLFWNYPRGRIFLGDGGAYFIGFWIAELSILLVIRNPMVSKWFPLLVCAYPVMETLFTIYRRISRRKNVGLPDAVHLHQLIFRRIIKIHIGQPLSPEHMTVLNSKTSPYLWLLTTTSTIPALLFWHIDWILQISFILFCLSYLWLYFSILKFRIPAWLLF